MTRIIIHGVAGRLGRVIVAMAQARGDEFQIVAGVDRYAQPEEFDFPVYTSLESCNDACDAIIDFSLPDAQPLVVAAAKRLGCGLVVATTGLTDVDRERLHDASRDIPVFTATNMSLGVNLQISLIKQAASVLGNDFDIEIIEKHHNQKLDAPSGTALTLAEEVAGEFPEGRELVYERHVVRHKRDKREIGISSVRGGTIVGEHNVLFIGEDEIIDITHIAQSRRIFATGALKAAAFIARQAPGFYGMNEMLAEENSVVKISAVREQSIINLTQLDHRKGEMADAFDAVSSINIDMISQSMPYQSAALIDVSFTLPSAALDTAIVALKGFGSISHRSGLARFTIEGPGMEHKSGVAAGVFRALTDAGVEIFLVTTSETKISFCIAEAQLDIAFSASKTQFGL